MDRTGTPVTDLTERDFTITENGVKQSITSFARAPLTQLAASPEARAAQSVSERDGTVPQTNSRRVFLLVVGQGRHEGPVHPFDGAIQFIRERLQPQDLVAVMAFNRVTELTSNHEDVARLFERLKARHYAVGFEVGLLPRGSVEITPAIQANIDALFESTPSVRLRSAPSLLLGTETLTAMDARSNRRPWNRMVTDWDTLKVYAGIEFLRRVNGEKHLVVLTRGFTINLRIANLPTGLLLDSREDDARLAARANDAQVSLNIVHTQGTFGADAFNIMASQNVADISGGQFTGVRTADAALARIDVATRARYVLGYTPANPAMDGKYRNVDVKVSRPNVTVLYRHGYTARPEMGPLDIREVVTSSRLRDAAASDFAHQDLNIRATASRVTGRDGAAQVRVDLNIDASRLSLTRMGAVTEGQIDLAILCGNEKQEVVGRLQQRMTISLNDEKYRQAQAGGIPYTAIVPITKAATHVKVVVYDYEADRVGSVSIPLK